MSLSGRFGAQIFKKSVMEIYDFLENAKTLDLSWLGVQIISIISENEDNLFAMLREQWEAGENEDGQAVGHYKPTTENFYAIVNPPASGLPKRAGDPYNLIWDGNLFRQLNISFEFSGTDELYLLIDSSAGSKDSLFKRIRGENLVQDPESIFGLTQINLGKMTDLTNEGIISKFYELLKIENHV